MRSATLRQAGGGSSAPMPLNASALSTAIEAGASSSVTNLLLKGFTGRGRVRARLRAARAQAENEGVCLVAEMDTLRKRVRGAENGAWVLIAHRRHNDSGSECDHQLRWRLRTGIHVNWSEIQPEISRLPQSMSEWYEEANLLAVMLNGLWRVNFQTRVLLARLLGDKALADKQEVCR